MGQLYKATKLVTDLEIMTSVIPPDELKKIIDNEMSNKFKASLFENITVKELRDDKQGLTRLDYSVAIMTEKDYLEMMKELKELREVVSLMSDMTRRVMNGKK